MANFHKIELNSQHSIIVYGGGGVGCETCSLSFVVAEACRFMCKHGVSKMMVDGAELRLLF